MEREKWLATLGYWQECGISFRSGSQLEFPVKRSPKPMVVSPSPSPSHFREEMAERYRPPPLNREETKNPTIGVESASPLVPPCQTDRLITKPVKAEERVDAIEKMVQKVALCQKCLLAHTRTQTVFGVGSPNAPVVFVGEGPGEEEDRFGKPFVGRAGGLLDRMFQAINFKRSDVYIANVVKCRPPGNRNPTPEEIALCQGYLFDQLELIRPKAIFCLGKFAILCLTGHSKAVGAAREKDFFWRGIPVIASYHPAYYLRTPSRKKDAWQDLLKLVKMLEKEDTHLPTPTLNPT